MQGFGFMLKEFTYSIKELDQICEAAAKPCNNE